MQLHDFGIFGGLVLAIVGPLVGALWMSQAGRFTRLEQGVDMARRDINSIRKTSVTPETCLAHKAAVTTEITSVRDRVTRLETVVNHSR